MGLKHIYEAFEQETFEKLKDAKGEDRTWKEAIIEWSGVEKNE